MAKKGRKSKAQMVVNPAMLGGGPVVSVAGPALNLTKKMSVLPTMEPVVLKSGVRSSAASMDAAKKHLLASAQARVAVSNRVAASMMLPHEYPVVRMSDHYSNRPTSTANPFSVVNVDYTSGGTSGIVGDGYSLILVTRDPQRAFGFSYPNPNSTTYKYSCRFTSLTPNQAPQQGYNSTWGGEIFMPMCHFVSDGTPGFIKPHGETLYCGQHGDMKGVWCNKGERITINVNIGDLTATSMFNAYCLVGDTWEHERANAFNLLTGDAVIITGTWGYYAVSIQDPAGVNNNVGVTLLTVGGQSLNSIFAWRCLQDLDVKASAINGIRVTGASVLITNTSPLFQKSGIVTITQFEPGYSFTDLMVNDASAQYKLASDINGKTLPWETGAYGFLKPASAVDLSMRHPFVVTTGGVMRDCTFELLPDSGFVAAVVTFPPGSAPFTGYPTGLMMLTVCHAVEFSSYDTWFASEIGTVSVQAYELALEMLKAVPQFHENPFHFSDIWNVLKKIAAEVLEVGPEIAMGLSTLIPSLRPVALPAAGALLAIRKATKTR